ncbi:hypothetical protein ABT160_15195 [Streptomyces sp. NPDC001941]|uniref:hypothetical protein n=1 Tax=Streptomyces sp. NPDC001941 TaxID=3154659 RepID=UPI00331BC7F5
MGGLRLKRTSSTVRPTAGVTAVATLLAALVICLAPGSAHHPGRAVAAPASGTQFSCPDDRGDCGLFPCLTPAVLSAPPLDAPLQADGPSRLTTAPPPCVLRARGDARPRAPDLHVLQVLRT